jgi:hypothetical protein
MGLDLSPQALAEMTSQYAVAIPQPVSVCHVISLSRIMFMHFSFSWKPGMLELQDVSSKCVCGVRASVSITVMTFTRKSGIHTLGCVHCYKS